MHYFPKDESLRQKWNRIGLSEFTGKKNIMRVYLSQLLQIENVIMFPRVKLSGELSHDFRHLSHYELTIISVIEIYYLLAFN